MGGETVARFSEPKALGAGFCFVEGPVLLQVEALKTKLAVLKGGSLHLGRDANRFSSLWKARDFYNVRPAADPCRFKTGSIDLGSKWDNW